MSGESGPEKRAFTMDVKADNPYSRLMALKRMGVVPNYEDIRNKSVAIIGVGGVGSVVAEMLTRCGIGKLLLFDYDTVELANMNRLFFRPEQAGMPKVEAAKQTLEGINPDVNIVPCTNNITHIDKYDVFVTDLTQRGGVKEGTGVDILLCCVDNFQARLTVNLVCLEHTIPWLESGVAENAVSGHIQLLLPGVTPCYECCPPLVVANGMPEAKREGVCAASLPTTIGIVAGLMSQNCLKYLLEFGTVSEYVGYDAMKDHFPDIALKPNADCRNDLCKKRQQEYLKKKAEIGEAAHPLYGRLVKQKEAEEKTIIEGKKKAAATASEWGIEVESEGKDFNLAVKGGSKGPDDKAVGLEYEYALDNQDNINVPDEPVQGESLEHLMAELSNLK